jgi:hypothetical protein
MTRTALAGERFTGCKSEERIAPGCAVVKWTSPRPPVDSHPASVELMTHRAARHGMDFYVSGSPNTGRQSLPESRPDPSSQPRGPRH